MPKKQTPAAGGLSTRALSQGARSLVMNGELVLYGVVDPFDMMEGSVRAIDVLNGLIELADQDTIKVRINSPGGSVVEGLAIYNNLRASGKPVEVHIDAMAASIASIIAMAGDRIVMAESATMMIHDPWGVAIGGSEDLRSTADEIDRQKQILVNIYAARTGLEASEIEALMKAETYMSAADAVERGFADEIDTPMQIAACALLDKKDLARLLAPVTARASEVAKPAAPAAQPQEKAMADQAASGVGGTNPAAPPAIENKDPVVTHLSAPSVDVKAERLAAAEAERARVTGILAAARSAKIDPADIFITGLIQNSIALPEAKMAIVDRWSETQNSRQDNPAGDQRPAAAVVTADGVDRWAQGAEKGLMARVGLAGGERNEFTGLTLTELARSSLSVRNMKTGSENRLEMVGRSFTVRNEAGLHSTSDFPQILQNVAYRSVLRGYQEVEETFPLWTGRGTASDFRPISRVDMGLFPALTKVEEGAEYTYATMGDTGTVVQVATYGKMFAITRQAIINDDLQFISDTPRKMGRAAKRTIGNLVYGILNGNPTMQDGVALFNAAHGNLATVVGQPTIATLAAGMTAMQVQTDMSGIGTGGGILPKFILTPPSLWLPTQTALYSQNYPGDAGQIRNPIQGMFTAISDSRLTGTSWYMAADPQQTDTIEVTYLDGVEEPFLDQKDGWSVDGVEMKVRMDAGVKALHWRGLYRNAGA
ncbi:ClpP-like prohead protease/major capsid protein fusion protein [Methylobacterium oryzisoli]|uniref:ClpP-like prohead protease/major capsid protein fusion protein n=1 Tax=Methylobacterium oryzisoli TaxID=3385502 RepID=UPI0038917523